MSSPTHALPLLQPHSPMQRIWGLVTAWWIVAVLLLSSFLLNAVQAVFVYVLPYVTPANTTTFTQRLHYSQTLANYYWQLFCFITEVWSGIQYRWTGDKIKADDNAILLGNHERGIDFTTGIVVSSRADAVGCGRMVTMLKKSLSYYPMVGWTHLMQGSIFLARNWQTDQQNLKAHLTAIEQNQYPKPMWIGIYPEGTRITPEKREKSQAYAREQNQSADSDKHLPILQHVLLPRTKGFTYLLKHLPTTIEAIYDVTAGYAGGGMYLHDPLAMNPGYFKCDQIHIHIERIDIQSLPDRSDEQATADWLMDRYKHKDQLLEYFSQHGRFPARDQVYQNTEALHDRYRFIFGSWSLVLSLLLRWLTGSATLSWVTALLTAATIARSYSHAKPAVLVVPDERGETLKQSQTNGHANGQKHNTADTEKLSTTEKAVRGK